MAVQIDAPISVGSPEDWWFEGASSKIAAVAASDASFIYADSGGALKTILFGFPVIAGVTPTAASLTARTVIKRYGQYADNEFYVVWNSALGSNLYSSLYPDYSDIVRSVSSPSLVEVNGQHGVSMRGWGGPGTKSEFWVTQVSRSVTFDYAASGTDGDNFAHLVGGLIAAIGAGLLLREMPAIARGIWDRTRTLIEPHEYEALWRDLVALKRPVAA